MDLSDTIIPRSDQLNAEDLLSGPRTVTITEVHKGASAEQPVDIVLNEFGPARPFKPSKTVRRILVLAWGPDANAYPGRRMTIYRDPGVKFGGMDVGGIRVSHLSHIAKPLTVALAVSKGKRAVHVVQPLADDAHAAPKSSTALEYRDKALDKAMTVETLRALYAEVQAKHLDGAEVIDGSGDTVTLGTLIKARGEELKRGASA